MQKKVDTSVRQLFELSAAGGHRSFFIVSGDKAEDMIPTLYNMLTRTLSRQRIPVLWCYENELHLSSTDSVRRRQLHGRRVDSDGELNSLDAFQSSVTIRYMKYRESSSVLGQTFGMLILQDMIQVTPSLLARTVETVEGGGLIVLLIRQLTALKALHALARGELPPREPGPFPKALRFMERVMRTASHCESCLFVDDELNVLSPSHDTAQKLIQREVPSNTLLRQQKLAAQAEIAEMTQTKPEFVKTLARQCRTVEQARVVVSCIDHLQGESSHIAVTASRGRGKSAALGLATAGALALGYSAITVTAPQPASVKTLFEFIVRGLNALGYREHADFELEQSSDQAERGQQVSLGLWLNSGGMRQRIVYVPPEEITTINGTLVVADEAASLPTTLVDSLMETQVPVFLASTIHGYEGTGRTLAARLLESGQAQAGSTRKPQCGCIHMEEPIRYSSGCPVEKWLTELLMLDAEPLPPLNDPGRPGEGQVLWVNRDALFGGSRASEMLLSAIWAMILCEDTRTDTDYLRILSDDPHVQIWIYCRVQDLDGVSLPVPLAVVLGQYNGALLGPDVGSEIPRLFVDAFAETGMGQLSGLLIRNTAVAQGLPASTLTHPIEAIVHMHTEPPHDAQDPQVLAGQLPLVLAVPIQHVKPHRLDWIGASARLTRQAVVTWLRLSFSTVHISEEIPQTLTVLKEIPSPSTLAETYAAQGPLGDTFTKRRSLGASEGWLAQYTLDFRAQFCQRLRSSFRDIHCVLALALISSAKESKRDVPGLANLMISPLDMQRLRTYTSSTGSVQYYSVLDVIPRVAEIAFTCGIGVGTDRTQTRATLVGVGLQGKTVDQVAQELGIVREDVMRQLRSAVYGAYNIIQKLNDHSEQTSHSRTYMPCVQFYVSSTLDQEKKQSIMKAAVDGINKAMHKSGNWVLTIVHDSMTMGFNADPNEPSAYVSVESIGGIDSKSNNVMARVFTDAVVSAVPNLDASHVYVSFTSMSASNFAYNGETFA